MKDRTFDAGTFYAALDSERAARRMTWKDVAAETGISASTLTRIGQGRRPDVDGLAKLLAWSGMSADPFILRQEPVRGPSTLATISTSLRRDSTLTPESVRALEQIVTAAYEQLRARGAGATTRGRRRADRSDPQ